MNAGELAEGIARRIGGSGPDDSDDRSTEGFSRSSWACSAHGCPLAGALSTGGARYCWAHFGVGLGGQERITRWLRTHPAVIAALSIPDGATREQMQAIGRGLRLAGLAELAPQTVTLTHEGYGRHGEDLAVARDELDSPRLYRYRLRSLVSQLLERAA